jgi:Cellulose binding domain
MRGRIRRQSIFLIVLLALLSLGLLPLANAQRPNAADTPDGAVKAQYTVDDASATDNQIRPLLNIVNLGNHDIPLRELKVRYYFKTDSAQTLVFTCHAAVVGCENLIGSFESIRSPRANHYLEIGFSKEAGSLAPRGQTGDILVGISKADGSNFDETGDFSYDRTWTSYIDWPKVTVYRNHKLLWGIEPGGGDDKLAPTFVPATYVPGRN